VNKATTAGPRKIDSPITRHPLPKLSKFFRREQEQSTGQCLMAGATLDSLQIDRSASSSELFRIPKGMHSSSGLVRDDQTFTPAKPRAFSGAANINRECDIFANLNT